MAMLSEKKLSNKLRIQLIERIAEVDLPGFVFLEIDAAISMLNYFKLSNLQRNIDAFMQYLVELADEYNKKMLSFSRKSLYPKNSISDYSGYLTDFLIRKKVKLSLSQQKMIGVESMYRVKCLLRMKEFINRRIYNEMNNELGSIHKKKLNST